MWHENVESALCDCKLIFVATKPGSRFVHLIFDFSAIFRCKIAAPFSLPQLVSNYFSVKKNGIHKKVRSIIFLTYFLGGGGGVGWGVVPGDERLGRRMVP